MPNFNKAKKIAGRKRKSEREERQARTVVNAILATLVALALAIFLWYSLVLM